MRDLTPLLAGKQLGRQMVDGADAGRGELECRPGLAHESYQLGDRLRGQRRVRNQDRGCRGDEADRREILARIVADVGKEVRPAREIRRIGEQQRVAVRRAPCELPGRDGAGAAAAAIFHHHLLAEGLAQLVGDRRLIASELVSRSAAWCRPARPSPPAASRSCRRRRPYSRSRSIGPRTGAHLLATMRAMTSLPPPAA